MTDDVLRVQNLMNWYLYGANESLRQHLPESPVALMPLYFLVTGWIDKGNHSAKAIEFYDCDSHNTPEECRELFLKAHIMARNIAVIPLFDLGRR